VNADRREIIVPSLVATSTRRSALPVLGALGVLGTAGEVLRIVSCTMVTAAANVNSRRGPGSTLFVMSYGDPRLHAVRLA
jgi:hypothetical protein